MPLPMYTQTSAFLGSFGRIKSIVAIAAGKGGVGKSSITTHLALALKAQGYQVGIMDTDIYGPSIRRMLPEDRLPSQKGEVIFPALCLGIKMISMAYFRKEQESTAVRAPIANGLISQFIQKVEWGELDFLLIDFPPGTGDIQLTLSQQANLTGAVMITTPQDVAVIDVRKAIHLFDQVKVPIIGIIENMSYYLDPHQQTPVYLFGRGGGERLAQGIGVPLLGQIPIDPLLCEICDRGLSLIIVDPNDEKLITRVFKEISRQFILHLEALQAKSSSGLQSFELIWKEISTV